MLLYTKPFQKINNTALNLASKCTTNILNLKLNEYIKKYKYIDKYMKE